MRNAVFAERGAIRRFTYSRSILDWLLRRPVRFGWGICCWQCNWYLIQPDHRRGLWTSFRKHRREVHGD